MLHVVTRCLLCFRAPITGYLTKAPLTSLTQHRDPSVPCGLEFQKTLRRPSDTETGTHTSSRGASELNNLHENYTISL